MGSADRTPDRVPSRPQSNYGDEGGLHVPLLSADELAERRAAAVRYLTKRGATDLIDVLGLAEPVASSRLGTLSVSCPQCQEPPGSPCVGGGGVKYPRGHRGRQRRAQEAKEAAA